MKLYKQALIVTSILTTILLWYLFFQDEYFSEWKNTQRDYKKLLVEKAEAPKAKELTQKYEIRVRQVYLEETGEIERCISCHTGIDNPQMVDAHQPFKTHPRDHLKEHPISEFGCVACHGGQGRALNKREAHAGPKSFAFWEHPVLPDEHNGSNCGACHDPEKVKNEAPKLAHGKQLSKTFGCQGCHIIDGYGGTLGTNLDNQGTYSSYHYVMQHLEGEHSTWNWLAQHFINPQRIVPDSLMKKQEISEEEAKDLTTYMLSLKGRQAYSEKRTPQDRYALIANHFGYEDLSGEELFGMMCAVCHGADGDPTRGKLSKQYNKYFPILLTKDYAEKASKEYIVQTIRQGHPGTLMSGFETGLTTDMIEKMTTYIKSFGEATELSADKITGDPAKGGRLYQKVCADCHGFYGEGVKGTNIRNAVFQRYASDAFIAAVIQNGITGTEMAPLETLEPGATEQDVANLVAYVRDLPKIALGAATGAVGWENLMDTAKHPGAISFYKNCNACHTIGRGDRKGPDLKDVLTRRNKDWVYKQITNPEGLVKSGDKDANELVRKFGRVMENPGLFPKEVSQVMKFLKNPEQGMAAVAEAMAVAAEKDKGDAERGRKLFTGEIALKNGGSSCLVCHSMPELGVLGGGNLGNDLLESELTLVEIASSLAKVNYKVMKDLYVQKPLDDEEINDLVAFIQTTREAKRKSPGGIWFVMLGVVGFIGLFFFIQVVWKKRIKNVRQELAKRRRK